MALPLWECHWCLWWASSPPAALPGLGTPPGGGMLWRGRGARTAAAACTGLEAGGGATCGLLMVSLLAAGFMILGMW